MFKVIKSVPLKSVLCISNLKYNNFNNCLRIPSFDVSTSAMNMEKVVEELKSNPFYDKYAKKISVLQKTSPEEFLTRLKGNEERKVTKNEQKASKLTPLAGQPGAPKNNSTILTKPKLLSDVMKIELIESKSSEEVQQLWLEYHLNKDCIVASLPVSKFELMIERGEKFPVFVLPLPRGQGYEFIVCQFSGNEVHFTPLISYQTHKENSPECLTMVYYPDLKETKGLVLMKGEFNKDVLTAIEAQCLANELQLYYGEENKKRTNLLERFTYSPEDFKHMDLIANLETLSF